MISCWFRSNFITTTKPICVYASKSKYFVVSPGRMNAYCCIILPRLPVETAMKITDSGWCSMLNLRQVIALWAACGSCRKNSGESCHQQPCKIQTAPPSEVGSRRRSAALPTRTGGAAAIVFFPCSGAAMGENERPSSSTAIGLCPCAINGQPAVITDLSEYDADVKVVFRLAPKNGECAYLLWGILITEMVLQLSSADLSAVAGFTVDNRGNSLCRLPLLFWWRPARRVLVTPGQ